MHEECGGYCYLLMQPVLENIVKLTEEIERKNKDLYDVTVELVEKSKLMLSLGLNVTNTFDEIVLLLAWRQIKII